MIRTVRSAGYRGGFTILEILTSVGILVIVAAGAAAIFNAITDTIGEGRKIAELNRFAARLERVMRRDFESMTREGFLVIVHQHAPGDLGNGGVVPLSPLQTLDDARRRRADEIMFFARGEFETARRALSPGMIARSDVAAIYYGHGQKRRPNLNDDPSDADDLTNPLDADNLFFNPKVTDFNVDEFARLGVVAADGIPNPNRYASDWALLRHVTLLAEPRDAGQNLPAEVFGVERLYEDRDWLEDNDRQISLQPAARTIFNSLGRTGYFVAAEPTGFVAPKWYREYDTGTDSVAPPMVRASGLVDIATDDLNQIRAVVTGLSADREPIDYWDAGASAPPPLPALGYEDFNAQFWGDDPSDMDDLGPTKASTLWVNDETGQFGTVENLAHIEFARKWMIDALPSIWSQNNTPPTPPFQLARVRYEDVPARLLFSEEDFDADDEGDRARAYALADQAMLGSGVFLPRCTEFIVEWSYGYTNPLVTDPADPGYKKVRWHGLDRWVDSNGDGIIETDGDAITPQPGEDHRVAQPYAKRPNAGNGDIEQGPATELIVGRPLIIGGGSPNEPEIATFGYPDQSGNDWPWPEFIRVTISLADPTDPTIEETFQMVFEIPDASQD